MIRILVDSSSDYSQEEVQEKGLVFVPIRIELAGKEYLDGIDLDTPADVMKALLRHPGMAASGAWTLLRCLI